MKDSEQGKGDDVSNDGEDQWGLLGFQFPPPLPSLAISSSLRSPVLVLHCLDGAFPAGVPARRSVGVGRWSGAAVANSGSGNALMLILVNSGRKSPWEENKNKTTFPGLTVAIGQPTQEERAQNHTREALVLLAGWCPSVGQRPGQDCRPST